MDGWIRLVSICYIIQLSNVYSYTRFCYNYCAKFRSCWNIFLECFQG